MSIGARWVAIGAGGAALFVVLAGCPADRTDEKCDPSPEICNDRDDDCDALVDDLDSDLDPSTATAWYADADGDGAGGGEPTLACDPPAGQVEVGGDCDDADADVHPGAAEVCGLLDDDCDGLVDDVDPDIDPSGTGSTFYEDADGDEFGNPDAPTLACTQPVGFVTDRTDCDDTSSELTPADLDQDGITSCDGDCVDSDPAIHPGAIEPDCGVDLDCDPGWDVAFADPIVLPIDLFGFTVADLDLDGVLDLLTASTHDNIVEVRAGLGDGTFGPPATIWAGPPGSSPWEVAPADLDGDGDPDLAIALMDGNTLQWVENLGAGTFGPAVVLTTDYDDPKSIHAVDLDADGDLDLVFSVDSEFYPPVEARVLWYENPGAGEPAAMQLVGEVGAGPLSDAVADLDADGDLDVVAVSATDDRIVWFENLGGAMFGSRRPLGNAADSPGVVRVADLDLDGLLDVAVASSLDDTIGWYRNLGGGLFGAESIVSSGLDHAADLQAVDLDLDGDDDLLASAYLGDRIVWFENVGGTFGAEQVVDGAFDSAGRVVAADVSGDGLPDVLGYSAWIGDGELRIHPSACE